MKKILSILFVVMMMFNLITPAMAATKTYKVSVSKSSGGSVTGAGSYEEGEEVVISAEAKNGYEFLGWTKIKGVEIENVATEEIMFIMPAEKVSMKANFKKIPTYKVTVSKASGGSVSGAGSYKAGEEVTITAEAKKGYEFAGWTSVKGVEIDNLSSEITFKMPTAKVSMKATFSKNSNKVSVKTTGGKVIGAGTYSRGEIVTLTAEAKSGYEFTGWSDIKGIDEEEIITDAETMEFEMPLNAVSVKANFKKIQTYKVTVSKATGGSVTGAGSYKEGE